MKTLAFVAAAILSVAASGSHSQEFDREQALAWVEHADPRTFFEREIAEGSERFRIVCGIGCAPPALELDERLVCYGRIAEEEVAGTSDTPRTKREEMLNDRAREFARAYNAMLRDRADKLGLRDCETGGGWRAIYGEVDSLRSDLGIALELGPSRESSRLELRVSLAQSTALTSELKSRLCSLGLRSGVRLRAGIEVRFAGEPSANFECENGGVAP